MCSQQDMLMLLLCSNLYLYEKFGSVTFYRDPDAEDEAEVDGHRDQVPEAEHRFGFLRVHV